MLIKGTSLSLGEIKRGTGSSSGAKTVTGLTKNSYYLVVFYCLTTTQYMTITSGATVVSQQPTSVSTRGNNYILIKTTSTTVGYTVNAAMANDVDFIPIIT